MLVPSLTVTPLTETVPIGPGRPIVREMQDADTPTDPNHKGRGKKSERRAKERGRVMTGEQRVEEKDEWVAESQVQRHMFL